MKYIIDFVNTTTDNQINEYLTSNNCTLVSTFSAFDKCYLVEAATKPAVTDIIETVIDDSETIMTPLVYNSTSTVTVDLTSEDEWWKIASLKNVDLTEFSYTFDRRGSNSCIYIMDSGINSSHVEFEDAEISNIYSYNDDYQDYNGHGTAIASVISGKTCGMTSTKLKSVKVFQADAPTYQSHFLAALDAIYTDVVANPSLFPIVNMSWSIAKNTYIENKIKTLINNNVWVICASGNNGQEIGNVTPASMPEVFVVGAYNRELEPCNFSNYPSAINTTPGETNYGAHFLWAPGEHIRAAIGNSYDFVAGTSIAAAIAAAATANNSFVFTRPDGVVTYKVRNTPMFAVATVRSSQGILNLAGNYNTSNNITVGFITQRYGDSPTVRLQQNSLQIHIPSGEEFDIQLTDPVYAEADGSSIEFISDIPAGLVQMGNFPVGNITTSSYDAKKIEYNVTHPTGFVRPHLIFLYVTTPDYTPATIPEEDQIMDVELLVAGCCGNIGGTVGNRYCLSGSGCFGCNNCGDKFLPQCVCGGGGPNCYYTDCP